MFIPLEQARCYQRSHIRSTQAFLIKFMISLSFCVDTAVLGAAPAESDIMGIAACLHEIHSLQLLTFLQAQFLLIESQV